MEKHLSAVHMRRPQLIVRLLLDRQSIENELFSIDSHKLILVTK